MYIYVYYIHDTRQKTPERQSFTPMVSGPDRAEADHGAAELEVKQPPETMV